MLPRFAAAALPALGITSLLLSQQPTFKEDVRLVEIYATVFDHGGHAVRGLTRDQFEIRDDGAVQPIRAFEASEKSLYCALLLDTSASMRDAMPVVRNAAREFIDALRPMDSIGIYDFSDHLEELSPVGNNHLAARHGLVRLRAEGRTALFDSISELAGALEAQPGKKAIVVLTDGGDNASLLNRQAAANRARKAGIPVFAVAEGDALDNPSSERLLHELSAQTGGHAYKAYHAKDIQIIFTNIASDLQNGYLLAFRPPPECKLTWHQLQISVINADHSLRVRARTGYATDSLTR